MIKIDNLIKVIKPPSPSLNRNKKFLRKLINQTLSERGKILDLGSGRRFLDNSILTLDIVPFKHVLIIGDAANLPIRSNSLDFIICTAVLEHVQNIQSTIDEIFRTLKSGSQLYIEVPFLQTFHGDPSDFRRYTLLGLQNLLKRFSYISSGVCVGPFSALAWFLRKTPAFMFGDNKVSRIIEFICGWLTFWIKYFDHLIPNLNKSHKVASAVYFLGRK